MQLELTNLKECTYCKGLGKVTYYHGDLDICPTCHGAGFVEGEFREYDTQP